MASAQAWSIKKRWASKFEEFLRTSSAGHLAVSLIKEDCVYLKYVPSYLVVSYIWDLTLTSPFHLHKKMKKIKKEIQCKVW